jgi:hypothetical protein
MFTVVVLAVAEESAFEGGKRTLAQWSLNPSVQTVEIVTVGC